MLTVKTGLNIATDCRRLLEKCLEWDVQLPSLEEFDGHTSHISEGEPIEQGLSFLCRTYTDCLLSVIKRGISEQQQKCLRGEHEAESRDPKVTQRFIFSERVEGETFWRVSKRKVAVCRHCQCFFPEERLKTEPFLPADVMET